MADKRYIVKQILETKRDFEYFSAYVDFENKTVLDVGCGKGLKTAIYSEYSEAVVGVDIGKNNVRTAYSTNVHSTKIAFLVADARYLPSKSNAFDIVIPNDSFEHFNNPAKCLAEMKRVLSENGSLCINFGPLWHSPFGSHLDFNSFLSFPWIHLLFPADIVERVLAKFGAPSPADFRQFKDLNRISVGGFEKIVESNRLRKVCFRLVSYPPFSILLRTPFKMLFATQVIAVLRT